MNEVVMHVKNAKFAECTLYCIQHLKCRSVNYNEEERMCELCNSEFDEDEAVMDDKRWRNYGTPAKHHGGYSEWIDGQCSVTCGIGEKIQYRRCDNPPSKYGGDDCKGPYLQTVSCYTRSCPVNGGYGPWSSYGSCSKTCGSETQSRSRACDTPTPMHGGHDCTSLGNSTETKSCNLKPCPLKYYIQKHGTCMSVTMEDCIRYHKTTSGSYWKGDRSDTHTPRGCFHRPGTGEIWYNTNQDSPKLCEDTDWHCVCLPPEYRIVTSERCMTHVSEDECRYYAESNYLIWKGSFGKSGIVPGCYYNPSKEVHYNTEWSSNAICGPTYYPCVCR